MSFTLNLFSSGILLLSVWHKNTSTPNKAESVFVDDCNISVCYTIFFRKKYYKIKAILKTYEYMKCYDILSFIFSFSIV